MPEAGYDHRSCLSFDVACVEFVESFESEQNATVQKPAPKGKRRATVPVPKHPPEVLLQMLGIDPDAAREKGLRVDAYTEELAESILTGEADWLYAMD